MAHYRRMDDTACDRVELLDWKRRVSELYARARSGPDPRAAWSEWRRERDDLMASHPQSPLAQEVRARFTGLPYFDYDPGARVLATVESVEPRRHDIATSGEGSYSFTRFGTAAFTLSATPLKLELYWLDGYGGGLFVPFADQTSGDESYGGGRYLLDTVKGADLGSVKDGLVFDFNFAYNPSCSYDPRWVCPLAPPANRLAAPIRAGERAMQAGAV